MNEQQKTILAQLVSEPGIIVVGDFLEATKRTLDNGKTYYSLVLVVDASTVNVDIEAEQFGQVSNAKKYQRIVANCEETFFQKSGRTAKRAKAIQLL